MAGVVHGNDVLFLVNNGTAYVPFVCAKDATIETATSFVSIATIGDGVWEKYAPQSLGYNITLTGVLKFDSANFSAWDLMLHQHQFVDIEYKMIFKDQENDNIKTVKGRALVERSSLTGNYGQFSQTSFSLKGNGAYIFINCDVSIGSLSVSTNGSGETLITMNNIEGTAESYTYTFNNGFEQSTTNTVINLGVLPSGRHTIRVIPVCTNDERGDEIEHDFLVVIPATEDPFTPNVTNVSFTDVSDTSVTLTWSHIGAAQEFPITVYNTATGNSFSIIADGPPRTITGLIPGTNYQFTIQANYLFGTSTGVAVFQTTTNAGNLPQQDTYTHSLTFESSTTDSESGVSGITPYPSPLYYFEFDAIPGYTGTTHSMALTKAGNMMIAINFSNSYMGQPFRYTDISGETFTGNFAAGTINFT